MKKLICLKTFSLAHNRVKLARSVGEEFEANDEVAQKLIRFKLAQVVEEPVTKKRKQEVVVEEPAKVEEPVVEEVVAEVEDDAISTE